MINLQKHKWLIIIIASLIFIILILMLWLKPQNNNSTVSNTPTTMPTTHTQHVVDQTSITAPSFASISQQDTEINCQLTLDAGQRLIVNEHTKNCFEYFITQIGEKELEQIRADFIAYISISYKDPALSQILDLWNRYMDYRNSLGEIQPPTGFHQDDPNYFRSIFNSTNNLRQKFFSKIEIEGLFGAEDTYHMYTLDRMEIFANTQLTEAQKAEKLKALLKQLPQDWQENLEQLNKLEDLRQLTADIKKRGGNADELRQMRLNLVGPEATQRLENLDVERSDWKNKVTYYLNERDQIMNSGLSDQAKKQAIQQLKEKQFTRSQDQLRLSTFESLHDQGSDLPFPD